MDEGLKKLLAIVLVVAFFLGAMLFFNQAINQGNEALGAGQDTIDNLSSQLDSASIPTIGGN